MKIFGHPIHIMLIHFPSALFPIHVLFTIIGKYTFSIDLVKSGFFVLIMGCVLGWLAMIFGLMDLIGVYKKREELMIKVLRHGGINTIVLIGFTWLALAQAKTLPDLTEDRVSLIILKVVLVALMIVGNYLGGQLILKYKIGVEP